MSHPFSTPAIRVSGNGSQNEYRPHGQRSPSSTNATSSTAIPMSIPGSREAVPPPLPPPKYIGAHIGPGQDPGWQWGNTPHSHSHRDVSSSPNLANVKPGSSLLSASLPRRAGREEVKSPREAPAFSRRSSQNSVSHDLLSNPSHDGSDDESRTGRPSLANFRYVVALISHMPSILLGSLLVRLSILRSWRVNAVLICFLKACIIRERLYFRSDVRRMSIHFSSAWYMVHSTSFSIWQTRPPSHVQTCL